MTEHTQAILSKATGLIVDSANRQGVNLADHFATVEDFQRAVIGLVVTQVMEIAGLEIDAALDLVIGEGTFEQIKAALEVTP
jgi:hypothetical protein